MESSDEDNDAIPSEVIQPPAIPPEMKEMALDQEPTNARLLPFFADVPKLYPKDIFMIDQRIHCIFRYVNAKSTTVHEEMLEMVRKALPHVMFKNKIQGKPQLIFQNIQYSAKESVFFHFSLEKILYQYIKF